MRPTSWLTVTGCCARGEPRPAGGCTFSGVDELASGQTLTEIEIAYDPETCRSLVEVGTLVSEHSFLDATFLHEDSRERSAEGFVAAADGGAPAAAAAQRRRAYNWSWYDEPARWAFDCDVEEGFADGCVLPPVNIVRNAIEWTPDGSCAVAPGTTGRVEYRITWLAATGWTVQQDTWQHSPDPIPCDQDIYSRNWNHFNNRVFCQALVDALPLPWPIRPEVRPHEHVLPAQRGERRSQRRRDLSLVGQQGRRLRVVPALRPQGGQHGGVGDR